MFSKMGSLEYLLIGEKKSVLEKVLSLFKKLEELGVFFRIFRNSKARSCADAAQKRIMMGAKGIPLEKELKSIYGRFEINGQLHHFMAHTFGNYMFSMEILKVVLKSDILPSIETLGDIQNSDQYGLINPFDIGDASESTVSDEMDIVHVFERDLVEREYGMSTMFTNAGEATWGVEFDIKSFIQSTPNAQIAPISHLKLPHQSPDTTVVHVLGGESAEYLFQLGSKLVSKFRVAFLPSGDWLLPRVTVHSRPEMALAQECEMRRDFLIKFLRDFIGTIKAGDVLLIPSLSILPIRVEISDLCKAQGVILVNDVEDFLSNVYSKMGSVVMCHSHLKRSMGNYLKEAIWPSEPLQEKLDRLIAAIKKEGAKPGHLASFWQIVKQTEASKIILASTELEWLYNLQRKEMGINVERPLEALLTKAVQVIKSKNTRT